MKRLAITFVILLLLCPNISFAQSSSIPKPPASWIAFQQEENAKRTAFFKQMKADRDAFLSSNPDAKAYLDQMQAYAKEHFAAWRAAHPRKIVTTP